MMIVRRVAAFAAVAILLAGALPVRAADPPAAVLSADTPLKTASGALFTAPTSWTVAGGGKMTVLTAPEGDVHVAVVDVTGAETGRDAAARAWLMYQPTFKRPISSRVATRKNDDGTTSFITIDPGNQGFAFVLGSGARTLTLRDGQHTYVFTSS